MADMKGLYTGRLVLAVVPGPDGKGLGLVELLSVSDPKHVKEVLDRMLERHQEAYDRIMPGFSMQQVGTRTYKGVEIASYRYDVSTNVPMPGMDAAPAQPSMMGLFNGMRWEMAFVDKDLIYTAGDPAVMDATIDRLETGGVDVTRMPPFSELMPLPKAKPVEVSSISLVKLIKQGLASLPGANPRILATIPDDTGGLAGYTLRLRGGELHTLTRMSYSEIVALQKSLPAVGGMVTQMLMSRMGVGQGAPPAAADTQCINNLRLIDAAKEQYALEKGLADGDVIPEPKDLGVYMKGGVLPTCPAGGEYSVNAVGKPPTCSIPKHALP
jgi:hypothetical protein